MTTHAAHYACYRRGCRRDECRTADRIYRKRAELRRLSGIPGHVAGPVVAAHLRQLTESGREIGDISSKSGVSVRAIGYILHGQAKVTRPKALSLLAVQPLAKSPRIAPTGVIRRAQALAAIGWPIEWTAQQAGIHPSYLFNIIGGRVPAIPRDLAARFVAVYREHSSRPGPSQFARSSACRNGWHSPLAWDDIDDPAEQPDVEPDRRLEPTRDELAAIRRAEITHLVAFNLSHAEIAARLGMNADYVRDIARALRTGTKQERTAA